MKKIFIVLTCLLMVCGIAQAKVYLIVNENTDEIYSLSNEDDAVMPESGYKKVILDVEIKEIELLSQPTDYKYKDKKFILNVQKVSDKENAKTAAEEKAVELKQIEDKARRSALEALIAEGKTFKHYKLSDFE